MRVLFISTSVPPSAESQSIRNAYLLRGLVERGAHVDVIAPACVGGDPSLLALLPPGVRVESTRRPLYDAAQGRIGRVRPAAARSLLRSAFAVAAGKVAAPDVRFDWARAATAAGRRRVAAARPDVLVSSAGSYTAHLAASRLAREHRLPWVAEYGDPWAFNPLPPASLTHIRWMNERLERRALRHCSALSVTTAETARGYERWLGSEPVPVHVVTCGFDAADFTAPPAPTDGGRMVVSYIGTASRSQRDLRPALDALAILRERDRATFDAIELRVIGSSPLAFELHAGRLGLTNVRFTGAVSYRESVHAIRDSSVLLLVGNQGQLQIPLKAFMYAGSGRPILFLGQLDGAEDPTWSLLAPMPATTYAASAAEPIAAALAAMVRDRRRLEAAGWERRASPQLRQFEWGAIGRRFADIVAAARPRGA